MQQPNYKITHGHNFRDRENNLESELLNVFSNRAPRSQFVVDIYQSASLFQDNWSPLCNRSSGISFLEKTSQGQKNFQQVAPFRSLFFHWVYTGWRENNSLGQASINVLQTCIIKTYDRKKPWHGIELQWNLDFSNPRFLETPDTSNQFFFPWDKLTLDNLNLRKFRNNLVRISILHPRLPD